MLKPTIVRSSSVDSVKNDGSAKRPVWLINLAATSLVINALLALTLVAMPFGKARVPPLPRTSLTANATFHPMPPPPPPSRGLFPSLPPPELSVREAASPPPLAASMRVAYNRIGKAGSSFMISLLTLLSTKNHFTLDNHGNFAPSKDVLAQELRSLPNNTIYVNHAGFIPSEGDLTWINVVREPIERWQSLHYYAVDPALRRDKAEQALAGRAKDAKCGCARLEFDECIDLLYHNNCPMQVPSQIQSFCEPGERCSRELATARAHERYLVVGLTEELALTVKLLEKVLPQMFDGAASLSSRGGHRSTNLVNGLTHTSLNGAISTRSRAQIAERSANYVEEKLFYEDAKRHFFAQACRLGLLGSETLREFHASDRSPPPSPVP
mmetsp:Transcript_24100/g.80123  ORF Transcript_24100/g.80123 Transcript_24100/m.80123 type:complete len:383 (+) Transcript_24100:103-1251(+)